MASAAGSVRVNFYAAARAAAGVSHVEVSPGPLDAVLARAVDQTQAKLADVLPQCSLLLDGLAMHGDTSRMAIEAGSEVDVLPPFAGG